METKVLALECSDLTGCTKCVWKNNVVTGILHKANPARAGSYKDHGTVWLQQIGHHKAQRGGFQAWGQPCGAGRDGEVHLALVGEELQQLGDSMVLAAEWRDKLGPVQMHIYMEKEKREKKVWTDPSKEAIAVELILSLGFQEFSFNLCIQTGRQMWLKQPSPCAKLSHTCLQTELSRTTTIFIVIQGLKTVQTLG